MSKISTVIGLLRKFGISGKKKSLKYQKVNKAAQTKRAANEKQRLARKRIQQALDDTLKRKISIQRNKSQAY
tara:strand:+ start:928 stop:1143 length:216 start_codon:yes stop_codon:yes gene_type:complete